MESPGEYLKRERELRGITRGDIAVRLRFSVSMVRAIEEDDEAVLPHPTYVKGFIRSYARNLGLDDNDAVLRYDAYARERDEIKERKARKERESGAAPSHEPAAQSQARSLTGGEVWSEVKVRFGLGTILSIAAVLVAAAIVYFAVFGGREYRPAQDIKAAPEARLVPVPAISPSVDIKPAQTVKPQAAPQAAVENTPQKESHAAAKEGDKPFVSPGPAAAVKHTLDIKAKKTTWVQVSIDGSKPFDVIVPEGSRATWNAENEFVLTIGNAGGVDVSFDGKSIGEIGAMAEVVRIKLPPLKPAPGEVTR